MLQLQEANAAGGGRSLRAGSLLCSKPTPLGMTHFLFLLMLKAKHSSDHVVEVDRVGSFCFICTSKIPDK